MGYFQQRASRTEQFCCESDLSVLLEVFLPSGFEPQLGGDLLLKDLRKNIYG